MIVNIKIQDDEARALFDFIKTEYRNTKIIKVREEVQKALQSLKKVEEQNKLFK